MRNYDVIITYLHNGKYERTDTVRVTASSVRSAIGKALDPALIRKRIGWREQVGTIFKIKVLVGGRVEGRKFRPMHKVPLKAVTG
jgi:hypothetical protein